MIQNRMTRMFKKYQVFIEFYGSGQKWNIQKTTKSEYPMEAKDRLVIKISKKFNDWSLGK